MTLHTWLAFFVAAWLISLAPGPGAVSTMASAVAVRRPPDRVQPDRARVGLLFFVLLAVASGLGALVVASATAFTVLKWLGVAYLIYLGIRQLRDHGAAQKADRRTRARTQPTEPRAALILQGFLVNASNPKGIVFMLAVAAAVHRSRPRRSSPQYALCGVDAAVYRRRGDERLRAVCLTRPATAALARAPQVDRPHVRRALRRRGRPAGLLRPSDVSGRRRRAACAAAGVVGVGLGARPAAFHRAPAPAAVAAGVGVDVGAVGGGALADAGDAVPGQVERVQQRRYEQAPTRRDLGAEARAQARPVDGEAPRGLAKPVGDDVGDRVSASRARNALRRSVRGRGPRSRSRGTRVRVRACRGRPRPTTP